MSSGPAGIAGRFRGETTAVPTTGEEEVRATGNGIAA